MDFPAQYTKNGKDSRRRRYAITKRGEIYDSGSFATKGIFEKAATSVWNGLNGFSKGAFSKKR